MSRNKLDIGPVSVAVGYNFKSMLAQRGGYDQT